MTRPPSERALLAAGNGEIMSTCNNCDNLSTERDYLRSYARAQERTALLAFNRCCEMERKLDELLRAADLWYAKEERGELPGFALDAADVIRHVANKPIAQTKESADIKAIRFGLVDGYTITVPPSKTPQTVTVSNPSATDVLRLLDEIEQFRKAAAAIDHRTINAGLSYYLDDKECDEVMAPLLQLCALAASRIP